MTQDSRPRCVLNTRPLEDAAELNERLLQLGMTVVSEPLLQISFFDELAPELKKFKAEVALKKLRARDAQAEKEKNEEQAAEVKKKRRLQKNNAQQQTWRKAKRERLGDEACCEEEKKQRRTNREKAKAKKKAAEDKKAAENKESCLALLYVIRRGHRTHGVLGP